MRFAIGWMRAEASALAEGCAFVAPLATPVGRSAWPAGHYPYFSAPSYAIGGTCRRAQRSAIYWPSWLIRPFNLSPSATASPVCRPLKQKHNKNMREG
jgi:hypothetical protein